jgi:hypothetical protein
MKINWHAQSLTNWKQTLKIRYSVSGPSFVYSCMHRLKNLHAYIEEPQDIYSNNVRHIM